jgi:hypothetical protein
MKKLILTWGFLSLATGVVNDLFLWIIFRFTIANVLQYVILWIPLIGVVLGVFGLFDSRKNRSLAVAGIVLNSLPILFVLLVFVAFQNVKVGL